MATNHDTPRVIWPKIFGIGLPYSGGEILPAVFKGSAYKWLHHEGGKLAQSLAYAQATGRAPLSEWPSATGFSDIFSVHKRHLPPLLLRDHLILLRDTFPDAYFVHTYRDPADWIAVQFWAQDGDHRSVCAWHAGIEEAVLPDHWLNEHGEYAALCKQVFADHPRYFEFNLTSDPIAKLYEFLDPAYALDPAAPVPALNVPSADIDAVVTYRAGLQQRPFQPPAQMILARKVADFARQTEDGHSKPQVLGTAAITLTKKYEVLDRTGAPVPLVQDNETGPYLLKPDTKGLERGQATLNEMLAHGAQPPLHIDMADARFLGIEGQRRPPRRTVAYNRRSGAKNITLWPLPGYHTLAPTGTPGGFPKDEIPFEDKEDRCVWLGNMTGRMSPVLTPDDRDRRSVYAIRDQALELDEDSPDWANIISDLDCVPRYRVVKTNHDNPDFEIGFVLRSKWRKLKESPAFAGLCVPKQRHSYFHKFRYILSLAGNDTGSNFLFAASSNMLILKEEDGWELFYTDAFKPWVHYVPLAEGAVDIDDKLKWARENPGACSAMARAATDVYDRLANPKTRHAYLTAIADGLNSEL
ncbi:glycosyl transferase family 90 [Octadecabacter sp.]|nr:glycosyl transferase family 90 [Octadecabacter sp.]